MLKWLAGLILTLLMLCRPEDAANGAREGLHQWYFAVAPSLFPFMALMPLLTSPEANRAYDAALGGFMRRLFDLPGSAAAPMVAGMIAGSPAGCASARSVAVTEGYSRGQLERLAAACSGLSPAFFISAVGAGMLGDAGLGRLLLRSQALTQLTLLALTRRFCRDDRPLAASPEGGAANPVLSIINVAGYMTLFGAIAGALRMPPVQLALDVTAGARLICALDAPWKLPALSALAGYGGLCVCAQNISILAKCGVSPVKFLLLRVLAGTMAAGFTALQLRIDWGATPAFAPQTLRISCICAVLLVIPALIRLKRTIF